MSTIEDRLREGARDVHAALETVPTRPLEQQSYGPWAGIAAAVVVLLLIGLPVLFLAQSGSSQPEVATEVTPSPNREGSTGLPWECPSVEPTEDVHLDAAEVPDALRYLPSNGTPDSAWGINYGPNCFRGPALIAARFADETRTSATALVVVWVESRIPEHPDDGSLVATTVAREPGVGKSTHVEGFEVFNFQRPPGVDQVEVTGKIDGLPVFIEATGIPPEGVMALVAEMEASRSSGEVRLTGSDLEVVHQVPVEAVVTDSIAWFVSGPNPGQSLEVRKEPGFHPYVSARGVIHGVEFMTVGDDVGVAATEGGGQAHLTWEIQPGVVAHLTDGKSIEQVVQLAESLVPANAEDLTPRDDTAWVNRVGTPVSDEEFAAASLEAPDAIVPGSARRIASTDVPDLGTLELYAAQLGSSALGVEDEEERNLYCIRGPGLVQNHQNQGLSGRCGEDPSLYEFGISLSASCDPRSVTYLAVWGLSSDAITAELTLTDGTTKTLRPEGGVIIWAWEQHGLGALEFTGGDPSEIQEFERLDGHWLPELPSFPCASTDQGGG